MKPRTSRSIVKKQEQVELILQKGHRLEKIALRELIEYFCKVIRERQAKAGAV